MMMAMMAMMVIMTMMMMMMMMVKAGLGVLVLDMQSAAGASVWLALHKPPPLPCLVSSESLTGSEFMWRCVCDFLYINILLASICASCCAMVSLHGNIFVALCSVPDATKLKVCLTQVPFRNNSRKFQPGHSHLPRWIDLVPEVNNLRGKYDWYADKKSPRCDQCVRSHFLNIWSVFDL